jgi:prepilin-type N-terminal cleavage/methylation domain-containing protein
VKIMTTRHNQAGFTILEIMVVVGIIGVLSAIAVPMVGNALASFRLTGDARGVSDTVSLVKMRAASDFSRVRLFVDLLGKAYHVESLDKTVTPNHWTTEGGTTSLSQNTSFSFGVVATPPPNSQAVIAQAPQCTDDLGAAIGNSACVMFNSRGVPIDSTGSPTALDAIYVTDGTAVLAVTVAATGMSRMWRTLPVSTPTWVLQ